MATMTNGSKRLFHNAYHYRTAPYGQKRSTHIHQGTDYGTSGLFTPQYPPLDGAVVKKVINKETNGNARGCYVEMHWPNLNLGMILQHLVEGSISLKVGDVLTKDTIIGKTGMTGKYSNGSKVSTGVHCHVETYAINTTARIDFETIDFDEIESKWFKQPEKIVEEPEMRYYEINELPEWYQAEVKELVDLGIIAGDGVTTLGGITEDQVKSAVWSLRLFKLK